MPQALSALSLELDGHPGGYQYLCFRLRMLMCGGLRGMAAETDAISRSIASRVARSLHMGPLTFETVLEISLVRQLDAWFDGSYRSYLLGHII